MIIKLNICDVHLLQQLRHKRVMHLSKKNKVINPLCNGVEAFLQMWLNCVGISCLRQDLQQLVIRQKVKPIVRRNVKCKWQSVVENDNNNN